MRVLFLLLLFICAVFSDCFAQYYTNQNKVWVFGKNAGLDFSSGSPVPFTSAIYQLEGCMSVSTPSGSLLFYTDGKKVYNKNHVLMPNGASVVDWPSTLSTTQAALIISVVNNPNQYYLFSIESTLPAQGCRMAYCIVDMTLAGGLGDVIPSTKGKILEDSLSEKMIAITGNNNNVWLLTHQKDTAIFKAYEITSSGIDTTPIISAVGRLSGYIGYKWGVMKVSTSRRKIVCQNGTWGYVGVKHGTEIYDFEPATGVVSNCIMLDSVTDGYGAEFSPDNTKLYIQQHFDGESKMRIHQYNIAMPDESSIKASKTEVAVVPTVISSDLKLGPDAKIYMRGVDSSFPGTDGPSQYMDCIASPNMLGSACNYVRHVVTFLPAEGITIGLPNLYVTTDTLAWAEVKMVNTTPDVSLFPNPTSKHLSITSSTEIEYIKIFDITGREVHSETFSIKTATVDVGKLPEGIYLVNINGTVTRTFIKR